MAYIPLDSLSLSDLGQYDDEYIVSNDIHFSDEKHSNFGLKQRRKELFQDLLFKFQAYFHLPNLHIAKIVFKYALYIHRIHWDSSKELNIKTLSRIKKAFGFTLCYSGQGIYVDRENVTPQAMMIDFLLSRNHELPASQIWETAKHLLLDKDPDFFKGFQEEWRQVVHDAFLHIHDEKLNSFLVKCFIGNLLCLLPYTHPSIGSEFHIPQFVQGTWKLVEYNIDQKIDLTPKWYSSPLPAFGLISHEGPPILAFQGSTFPSGDGFWAAIVSDFGFGLPVGRLPSLFGKKPLQSWMKGKKDIQMYGVSLGGAIALNVAQEYPKYFSTVNVYNPPGFYPWNRRKIEGVEVNIISQWNDLVSTVGLFPEGSRVNVYRALLKFEENFIKAHNRSYSGAEQVIYIKTSPGVENRRLSRLTFTLLHILTPVFFLPLFSLHLISRLFVRTCEFFSSLFRRESDF